MTNDLISREALKKALDELFESGGYDSGLVMNTIDTAPTISPYKAIHDELHKGEEHISEVKKNETDN